MLVLRVLLVALSTVLTIGAAVALRADSTGPLPPAAVAALAAVVALAQWRLLRGERPAVAVLSGLLLVQVASQLGLQAIGGLSGGGLPAVLCCPPAPVDQDAGVVALLTAQAGVALLVVQVLAASLTAVSVRSVHVVLVNALLRVAASLREHLPLIARMLDLLCASTRHATPAALPAARRDAVLLPPRRLLLARSVTRRGPPRRHTRPPSSLLHLHVHGVAVA